MTRMIRGFSHASAACFFAMSSQLESIETIVALPPLPPPDPRNSRKIWSAEHETTIKSRERVTPFSGLDLYFPVVVKGRSLYHIGRSLFTAHRFLKLSRAASTPAFASQRENRS